MHILRRRSRDLTGPLKIASYDGSPNYYVKLVDLNTQACDSRTGALGTAKRTSSGTQTSYSKADAELTFEREGDKLAGYTLQLQKQIDGNLREIQIAASNF